MSIEKWKKKRLKAPEFPKRSNFPELYVLALKQYRADRKKFLRDSRKNDKYVYQIDNAVQHLKQIRDLKKRDYKLKKLQQLQNRSNKKIDSYL